MYINFVHFVHLFGHFIFSFVCVCKHLSICSFASHCIIFLQICVVKERLVQRSDLPPLVVEIGKHQLVAFSVVF